MRHSIKASGKPLALSSDEPPRTIGSVNRAFSLKDNPEWCEWAASKIEELEQEVSELTTENKILEVDVLLKARVIKQLEAQLQGSRQHVTEVNQDG